MKKFNIHIDKPEPTDEQIAKHQNFDKLLQQYYSATKVNFWQRLLRSPLSWVGIAAVVGIMVWLVAQAGQKTLPADASMAENTSVNKASTAVFPENIASYSLPLATTATQQRTRMGVSITVPAKIQLHYRELHTSQLLSMLEIFATANGSRIVPAKATPMDISYMGGDKTARAVYQYDVATSTWKKIGVERVTEISAMAALPPKPTLESVKARFIAENPQPVVAAPTQPFALDLDLTALPELDAYDRVCWDYVSSSHPNRRAWDETWDNVSLSRAGGDLYTLTFSRRGESVAVTARALKGSAACRNAEDADMMHKSVDKKLSDAQAVKSAYDTELAQWEALRKAAENQPKTYKRSFVAPSVGIYKAE